MKHYYFKFQEKNAGLEKWLGRQERSVPLSIYYGTWKTSEKDLILHTKNLQKRRQIELFFSLEKEKKEEIFFWIFYRSQIFCFESLDLHVSDGPDWVVSEDGNLPKKIEAAEYKKYEKIRLPDFFSNINANQAYNRGTIRELRGSEREYADILLKNGILKITVDNFLEYLSPIEFETLIFVIFNRKGNFCSSFRGGTLKDYDLRIRLKEDFCGIPKGDHWIQVKMKGGVKREIDGYLITTSKEESADSKTLGRKWLRARVEESTEIQSWLKESVFDYENIECIF
jgi:hypothetical protein